MLWEVCGAKNDEREVAVLCWHRQDHVSLKKRRRRTERKVSEKKL